MDPLTGLPAGPSSGGNALQGGPQAAGGVNFTLFGNPSGADTSGSIDWRLLAVIVVALLLAIVLVKVL